MVAISTDTFLELVLKSHYLLCVVHSKYRCDFFLGLFSFPIIAKTNIVCYGPLTTQYIVQDWHVVVKIFFYLCVKTHPITFWICKICSFILELFIYFPKTDFLLLFQPTLLLSEISLHIFALLVLIAAYFPILFLLIILPAQDSFLRAF